jgi:hypothetical protein
MSPRQQRCAVGAAIVGVHAVVLWYLVQMRQLRHTAARATDQPLVYIRYFELPAPTSGPDRTSARPPGAPRALPRQAPSEGPSSAPSPASPEIPSHGEWDRAAQDAARNLVSGMARGAQRKCEESATPDSVVPLCRKHPRRFEWNEEPERAGFENGLPYLRLGRCILVLGIIGCPVGAGPEASGHLFDDLKDPDRERSSVPAVSEINEPADAASPHRSVLSDPASHRAAASR